MKRKLFLLTFALFLVSGLVACGDNTPTGIIDTEVIDTEIIDLGMSDGLIFNRVEIAYEMEISFVSGAFYLSIEEEQLLEAFPIFERMDEIILENPRSDWGRWNTHVHYTIEGELEDLRTRVYFLNEEGVIPLDIWVGFGMHPRVTSEYGLDRDLELEYSYVNAIPVKLLMFEDNRDQYTFDARFEIEDVSYRVRFRDYLERGQERMVEVVTGLIADGIVVFSVLENPVIPEIRSELFTLEEARNDSDFGVFVPTYLPYEVVFQSAYRSYREYVNQNLLHMGWEVTYDEMYLYDMYTQWVAERTSDSPVFAFDEIFWLSNTLDWRISPIRESDLDQVMSPEEFLFTELEPWEQPILRVEGLTLDIVRMHEHVSISSPQGADWDEDKDENDIFLPLETSSIQLRVLFGDILLEIHTGHGNIPPEMIWEMLISIPAFN